ncbi:hypothetical protein Sango_2985400 [Sesamum angolense]|uniref:CCHC-type domain-containing protein n=1 Tax=Sesamum angolense TaxID=2727404 RepID=A0AAE1T3Q2_9LAMI|nr:hypothetical protein Sango_2985400 [Sesamum angolense]
MKAHGGGHRMAHGRSMKKMPDGAHDGEPKRIKRNLQGPLSISQNPPNTILEANKFDGTNYSNWLKNLRIVLDFENQIYVLDKSLPQTLQEGFLPRERLTFKKSTQWHEDNRKVRSIVLSSMSNEIQKQYKRYEDVWLIMHRMKELYAVSDRHIRYAVTKALFGARMIEGSSVREHGVMMISLVEKLKDLQADFDKEETKGKVARREKRKKDETSSTAASTSSVPLTPLGGGKRKRNMVRQSKIPNDVCIYCREKGHRKMECPKLLSDEGEDEE